MGDSNWWVGSAEIYVNAMCMLMHRFPHGIEKVSQSAVAQYSGKGVDMAIREEGHAGTKD